MDHSDASDVLIEVLSKHFCQRLPFVYDHTMWIVVVSVTGIKTAAMLWTEFPEFRHKYGTSFTLNMSIILRPLCREFNSLYNKWTL